MLEIDISLSKQGDDLPALAISLSKVHKHIIELYWDSPHDLDLHVVALCNGKLTSSEALLSTYNQGLVLSENTAQKRRSGDKRPFQNLSGSLKHYGDSRTGLIISGKTPDEVVELDHDLFDPQWDELAFIISSHPPRSVKFKEVNGARLVIKDDEGEIQLAANLTSEFDEYDVVQIGGLLLNPDTFSWDFNPTGRGINGTFMDLLASVR